MLYIVMQAATLCEAVNRFFKFILRMNNECSCFMVCATYMMVASGMYMHIILSRVIHSLVPRLTHSHSEELGIRLGLFMHC